MTEQGGWDMGGYAPCAYKVTSWTTLFPALGNYGKFNTLSNIYTAKLYTYYLTRLQFGQYLTFLQDVGAAIIQNQAIDTDVSTYDYFCNTLYQNITTAISAKSNVNQDTYAKILKDFENVLRRSQSFNGQAVYSTFFKYYSVMMNCAWGIIPLANFKYAISSTGIKTIPSDPFTVFPMLEDAIRVYPIILRIPDKEQGSDLFTGVCHLDGAWHLGAAGSGVIGSPFGRFPQKHPFNNFERPQDIAGIKYVDYSQVTHEYIWGLMLGLDTIPDKYTGQIRGAPMFYKMPFDFLDAFAQPTAG